MPQALSPAPRFAAITLLAAACGVSSAGAQAPTLLDPDRAAVVAPEVARRFVHLADKRRVDLAIIGDSNVRNARVSGHEDGMLRAFAARFGCYATRVEPAAGQGGWGGPLTGCSSSQAPPFVGDSFPRPMSSYPFPDISFPTGGAYLPPGITAPDSYNYGLGLTPEHPLGFEGRLRYHLTHHTFRTPSNGRINLSVREVYPADPSHNHAFVPDISTAEAQPGLRDLAVEVPAAARPESGIMFCFTDYGNRRGARGPFFALWHRVENADTAAGIAYSSLLYQGGRTARAACESLLGVGAGGAPLQEWLRQATRLQGDDRAGAVMLFQIIHGGNDSLDGAPSLGPIGGLPSNSAEGYKDNLQGIINLLGRAWAIGGYDPDNLFFLIGPYHPRDERLATNQAAERVASELCAENPNTMAIRGTMLSNETEFRANHWYTDDIDLAHLSVDGFRAWGRGAVLALQRAACPADVNDSRSCTVEDLFGFLIGFFGEQQVGDFDRNGEWTIEDVFEFLSAYFRGC